MKTHKKATTTRRVALVTTAALAATGLATTGVPTTAYAADLAATEVAAWPTSTWTPPSSDPSGIAFIPGKGLLVSDAEIEETLAAPINHNNNLFTSTLAGVKIGHGSTVGWSNEPTGVSYVHAPGNLRHGRLFVTDDDQKRVYEIGGAGTDGQFGTGDDGARTTFRTTPFGNTDPEDVAYDFNRNQLWIAGGLSTIISRVSPGPDNNFATLGDNVAKNFELPPVNDPTDPLKVPSPEGMAYDPGRGTILVLDGEAGRIYEFAVNGAVLNTIHLDNIDQQSAGGIALDPAQTGSARTYYLADRGLDPNGERPATCTPPPGGECEAFNDGLIHEIQVTGLPALGNLPPLADAGEAMIADTNETITLVGSGEDPETPAAGLTYTWSRVSGPGTFTLGTANAPTTTAVFSQAGTHTMRLTVSDGTSTHADEVLVHAFAPGAPRTVAIPVRNASDDAQEGIGGTDAFYTDIGSADNELGHNGNAQSQKELLGLRFANLPIPNGSTIDSAKIQFRVDEAGSGPASFTIVGEAADNSETYLEGRRRDAAGNVLPGYISMRPTTAATVTWSPNAWPAPATTEGGLSGPDQLTPDLKAILQEVVSRPAWLKGNAAAFMFQGTGRRTAEAKDGREPPYMTVTFRSPLANVAPIVDAGPNSAVTLPGQAGLNGTVTDDGKPGPVTTTWSKVSGPGTVTFADPGAAATTAAFSQAGSYVLQLTANDGALSGSDTVTVTVADVPNAPPTVNAGPNASVTMPGQAALNGTVTDDGRPGPLTTTWSRASGPGTVTFGNAAAVDTSAGFSQAGSYVLRLTANDGAVSRSDTVTVTVSAAIVTPSLTAQASHSTRRTGRTVTITGTTTPAVTGQVIRLQRFQGGSWVTVATRSVTAGTSRTVQFNVTSSSVGTVQYRVNSPAVAGRSNAATSNTVSVSYTRN